MQALDTNVQIIIGASVAILLIAVWLFMRSRHKTRVRSFRPDVLDEGVAPANRNQALIDAPSAAKAALATSGPDVMNIIGEVDVATASNGDDLSRIKGVGPKIVTLLATLGITSFEQIAAWTDADIERIDAQLGAFAGRPKRDKWMEQARLLATGDQTGYEEKFGKL